MSNSPRRRAIKQERFERKRLKRLQSPAGDAFAVLFFRLLSGEVARHERLLDGTYAHTFTYPEKGPVG